MNKFKGHPGENKTQPKTNKQFFVLFIHIKGERKKREKDEKQAHGKKRESGSLELA